MGFITEKFHQFPIILCANLLGDKRSTGFQNTVDFLGIEITVPVDHHIETSIVEWQFSFSITGPEVNAQRKQNLFAKRYIGRIILHRRGFLVRMIQRQQELSSTSVDVHDFHFQAQVFFDYRPVIPGQIILLRIAPIDVREIPAVDVGNSFFGLPVF